MTTAMIAPPACSSTTGATGPATTLLGSLPNHVAPAMIHQSPA